MKTQKEIRDSFLNFFREKNHHIVQSAPVIPDKDPTLLFTNAGMNQFKNIFLGTLKEEHNRVADTQKCIRASGKHNDLDEVGRDGCHHTFFEMLGNWSFGDYFKKDAIAYAWEFLTKVCGLDRNLLYATYFEGNSAEGIEPDLEAKQHWESETDIDPSHIMAFSGKYNFWEMGETGPCGPCSEIHIDLGKSRCEKQGDPNHVCRVNGDCQRFMEIWNLVFMQYNRKKDKTLIRLEKNHVDTGMGFERLTSIMQGKNSNYDTDLFTPLIQKIEQLTGAKYGQNEDTDVAIRVCADHIKALCFAIADGALPEKKGRGSVLRSILRRASRFGKQVLKQEEPFLYKLVGTVGEIYSTIFPESVSEAERITKIIKAEEELFAQTLETGLARFNSLIANIGDAKEIDGHEAYRLYHQDGFPKDLIAQMAAEHNLTIDEKGWLEAENTHKERSKSEAKEALFDPLLLEKLPATQFVGYWEEELASQCGTEAEAKPLMMPSPKTIVLDRTPFYGESGGQVGDKGVITGENFLFEVEDVQKNGDFIIHIGNLKQGSQENLPEKVKATVSEKLRRSTMAAHTATHLLHKALRTVLGEHVVQRGSEVSPGYLRFDFRHPQAVTPEQLLKIEQIVNEKICENIPLKISHKNLEEAKKDGFMALFGEKYGDIVRVIEIGDYSKELCGGTHCIRTGDIGSFYILSESSSEAGVRRIEAVVSEESIKRMQFDRAFVKRISSIVNAPIGDIPDRIEQLKSLAKELKKLKVAGEKQDIAAIKDKSVLSAQTINGIRIIVNSFDGVSNESLGELADQIRSEQKICGMLFTVNEGSIYIIGFASKDIAGKDKINIGQVVKKISSTLSGGGGGRFDFAKGGGKDKEKLPDAIMEAHKILAEAAEKI